MLSNRNSEAAVVNKHLATGLALVALLALAFPARAQIWTEVGDAGQLVTTAQQVQVGALAPVNTISGNIALLADVDLYLIFIPNPALFSATTAGQIGTLTDTQLFLFTDIGFGVRFNDDVIAANLRSTIPVGSLAGFQPGHYLLGISAFNNDPVSPGGQDIFPDTKVGVFGATGAGGGPPLSGGVLTPGTGATGTYNIALTGATGVVPEPASITLLGSGALGLLAYAWRRRNRQACR